MVTQHDHHDPDLVITGRPGGPYIATWSLAAGRLSQELVMAAVLAELSVQARSNVHGCSLGKRIISIKGFIDSKMER